MGNRNFRSRMHYSSTESRVFNSMSLNVSHGRPHSYDPFPVDALELLVINCNNIV